MKITHRVRRSLAVGAAGAMVLSLLPASASFAGVEEICEDAPEADFDDADSIAEAQELNVNCLAAYAITVGDNDNNFNPGAGTTRQHMALFVARTLSQAEDGDLTIPEDTDDEFSDISNVTPPEARHAINWLESRGLVNGYDDGTYRPGNIVPRDQMATFIFRLLEELGVALNENAEDAFEDDNASFHEDSINALADANVIGGFPDGTFRPAIPVSRQQMAGFVIGGGGAVDDAGNWSGEFVTDEPEPTTNQSFAVSPQEEATNPASSGPTTNEGRRTYSVSGLDDNATYNVALFPAESVTVTDGTVSFEDATDDGQADDAGNTSANVETINGTATDRTDEQTASPVNGTITFTVDSVGAESVIPAVWLDADVDDQGDAAPDNQLDVDANGEPTEDFGIGGQKNWFVEAATGDPAVAETVTLVNEEDNFFDTDAGVRYFYSSDDVFQIVDGTCANVSQATFETNLSEGDVLDATSDYVAQADRADQGNSTLCIDDVAPAGPTNVTATRDADAPTTAITVTWDTEDVDAQRVYVAQEDIDPCDTLAFADYTLDAELAGDAVEYTDEGLEADTRYCYLVTSVQDGDESTDVITAQTTGDATTAVDEPTIENAELIDDAILTGAADSNDVWQLVFSETMDTTQLNETLDLTDADGDVIRVECGTAPVADDGITTALCTWSTTTVADDTLNFELLEDAEDRNAAGNGVAEYPLTITDTENIIDLNDGVDVSLAESADVVIDDES